MNDLVHASGAEIRQQARAGTWRGPTAGLAQGFVQANLVVVPQQQAFDFLLFCHRNPRPCPLLDVTDAGSPQPSRIAAGSDVRTDVPRYRVYRYGLLVEEPHDLLQWWRADLVAFLLGCSFTFEHALLRAGLPVRHIEQGCNVPMYRTNIACQPAGPFHGPLVVSMRPMTRAQAGVAAEICRHFPRAHGEPVHCADPAAIGIADLDAPDYGEAVELRAGEIPVFWACGVTPQAVAVEARPPLLLTHSPGHMFLTDLRETDLQELA